MYCNLRRSGNIQALKNYILGACCLVNELPSIYITSRLLFHLQFSRFSQDVPLQSEFISTMDSTFGKALKFMVAALAITASAAPTSVEELQPKVETRNTPETVLSSHLANGLTAQLHLQHPEDERFTNGWLPEDFVNLFETVQEEMQDTIREQRHPEIFSTILFADHNGNQHHVSLSTSADDHQNVNQAFNDVTLGMNALVARAEAENTALIGTTQWVIQFFRSNSLVFSLIFFLLG